MKAVVIAIIMFLGGVTTALCQSGNTSRVISTVDTLTSGDLMITQEFVVDVPVEKLWAAYTTADKMNQWIAPLVAVDFRIGGTIRTNYNSAGRIGDSTTNILHIINFIPNRMLTLQAEVSRNWPEFIQEDEKRLYNVILLEEISSGRTRVISYGLGYRNTEKYHTLLEYFLSANTWVYEQFIQYLEKGVPSNFQYGDGH